MTFLSRLMAPVTRNAETPTDDRHEANGRVKAGETRTAKVQAEYARLFATPTTVGKAAAQYSTDGVDHVTMLNQIYRYEKKGLMTRAGVEDSPGRPLLFVWKGTQ